MRGLISFDNVGTSVLQCFIMLTLEGWVETMNYLREAGAKYCWIYFVSGTFLLAFFASQIALAGKNVFLLFFCSFFSHCFLPVFLSFSFRIFLFFSFLLCLSHPTVWVKKFVPKSANKGKNLKLGQFMKQRKKSHFLGANKIKQNLMCL